jgi:exopolysaccharide biosynthesis polyprenyl glycosylphosphotransferase
MKALLQPSMRATRAEQGDTARGETLRAQRQSTAVRVARRRVATDALMLVLAGVVETLSAPAAGISQSPGWRLGFVALVLAALGLRGVYRAKVGQQFLDEARTILSATAVAAMVIAFLRVAFTDNYAVAEETIRGWLFAAVYLVVGRAILAIVTDRSNQLGRGAPTLILGAGKVGHLVARRLLAHPELGLRPIGFVDSDPLEAERPSGLPVLGSQDDLERIVREHGAEHAIVSFSNAPHETQLGIARALQRMRISISIVPRLFEVMPDKIALQRVGGMPLVTLYPSNPRDWRISVKYASDRVLALLATLVVSPLLILAAAGTAVTIGRPILFRQRRVGLDDREFEMLKFRTMTGRPEEQGEADAEWAARATGDAAAGEGTASSPIDERRTTRFGAFLRRTGFDELPQLFNVLRGEMSIVGPRPERSSYVALFKHRVRRYSDRHQVKAGITGWAQVHGLRGSTSLDERIEWDNYYIENWSLWLDLKILLLTLLAIFRTPAE